MDHYYLFHHLQLQVSLHPNLFLASCFSSSLSLVFSFLFTTFPSAIVSQHLSPLAATLVHASRGRQEQAGAERVLSK